MPKRGSSGGRSAEDNQLIVSRTANGLSQYEGISWVQSDSKWHARCYCVATQKNVDIGRFVEEVDAARAYTDYVQHITEHITTYRPPVKMPGSSSRFFGVFWVKSQAKWVAQLGRTHLKFHLKEEDAAQAYNDEVKRLRLPADHLNILGNAGDITTAASEICRGTADANYVGAAPTTARPQDPSAPAALTTSAASGGWVRVGSPEYSAPLPRVDSCLDTLT